MFDHISLSVNDYPKSLEFYDNSLKELGYERIMTFEAEKDQNAAAGYGKNAKPSFWIVPDGRSDEYVGKSRGFHIAFQSNALEEIQHWYKKCIEFGGIDNGAPGPRPEYHPGYYAAFIIDPSGWRIEACLHHYNGE
jgi:catechol 2,3-dioxygenase-like lactoylglutathione lyase family enzyme